MNTYTREGQQRLVKALFDPTTVKVECFWLEGGDLHVIASASAKVLGDTGPVHMSMEIRPDGTG